MSEQRFNAIRARYLALEAKYDAKRSDLVAKYGRMADIPFSPREKLYQQRARLDKVGDAFFDLLDKISPRSWRSGVGFYWVLTELTYADATTHGELSTSPAPGWGSSQATMRLLCSAVYGS